METTKIRILCAKVYEREGRRVYLLDDNDEITIFAEDFAKGVKESVLIGIIEAGAKSAEKIDDPLALLQHAAVTTKAAEDVKKAKIVVFIETEDEIKFPENQPSDFEAAIFCELLNRENA